MRSSGGVSAKEYSRLMQQARRRTAAENYTRIDRGYREIGEQRIYFRSRYEANVARYFEWLKSRGEIAAWAYEPREDEFWFPIRRGTRSYLPDFKVTETDGTTTYYEVKGWMDRKSALKLRRMKKYYPNVKIVVIGREEHALLGRQIGGIVPGWERGSR